MNFSINYDNEKNTGEVTFDNFSEAVNILNDDGDIVSESGESFYETIKAILLCSTPWLHCDGDLRNDTEITLIFPQAQNSFYDTKHHLMMLVSYFNESYIELSRVLVDGSRIKYNAYATIVWRSEPIKYTGNVLFSWEYI